MRRGEIESRIYFGFERSVAVKLGPVIDGDRPDWMELRVDEVSRACVAECRSASLEFADREVAGFALDHRENARPRLAVSEHRVGLPVPDSAARVRGGWSLTDQALAGESPARVTLAIAFAKPFRRAAQMRVQIAAVGFVVPHMPIDRLVTDRKN